MMVTIPFLLPAIITLIGLGISYFANEQHNIKRYTIVIVHFLLILILGILAV